MRFFLIFSLLLSFLQAKTPYELGKTLYMQKGCYSCHGIKAEGISNYPSLANRAKGYLSYKLKRFRSKLSDNQQQEMMIAFSVDLTDEDIDNLTTFFTDFVDEASEKKYDDNFYREGDGGS